VVLATCHSAQRAIAGRGLDSLPGDDLFGLPATLCEAGVHQLLGALWSAQDNAARTIVSEFHRAYARGAEADVALRDALHAYLANASHPREAFFWAPFTLTAFSRRV
jgi:CHAT domain-containing protein